MTTQPVTIGEARDRIRSEERERVLDLAPLVTAIQAMWRIGGHPDERQPEIEWAFALGWAGLLRNELLIALGEEIPEAWR